MMNEKLNKEMLEVLQAINKFWQEGPNTPLHPGAQLFETEVTIQELVGFVVSHTSWQAELEARGATK